jgi:soluble lytic murein transglycosylase-like protein
MAVVCVLGLGGGQFLARCRDAPAAEGKQCRTGCAGWHEAGRSRRTHERSFYQLRSIILAFALTGASAAQLYAPPVPLSQLRVANHGAIAWAHRYHIDVTLARKIIRAASRNGLDQRVAFRLVKRESSFRMHMLGGAGEIGLTQIKPGTARDLQPGITVGRLFEPDVNLDLGFAYLAQLRKRYHGDMWRAATAYNQGMTMADTLPGTTGYAIELLGPPPGAGATVPALNITPLPRTQRCRPRETCKGRKTASAA